MTYEYEQYLAHFGIKGMRWGVRRYQNEDGSLTEAGIERYQKYQNKNKKLFDQLKAEKNEDKAARIGKKIMHNVYKGNKYVEKLDLDEYVKNKTSPKEVERYLKNKDKVTKNGSKKFIQKVTSNGTDPFGSYWLLPDKYRITPISKIRKKKQRKQAIENFIEKVKNKAVTELKRPIFQKNAEAWAVNYDDDEWEYWDE